MFDTVFKYPYHYDMSKTLLIETKSVLGELRSLSVAVDAQLRDLAAYSDCVLVESRRKNSNTKYYYMKKRGRSPKRYVGKNSSALVEDVKSSKYFEKLRKIIDHDIDLLERIKEEYVIPDHSRINNLLPNVYKTDSPPKALPSSPAAAEWKRQKESEKAKYRPFRPEDLKYRAQDGTMMRSLSEVIIANYLLSLGITYVYELPFTHHGKTILPDFTILSPVDNRTVIIIEHQGAMNSDEYQGKFIRTVLFYLETKLVPNKDVFFTFNHLDKSLDTRQLDSILRIAFGFEPEGLSQTRPSPMEN